MSARPPPASRLEVSEPSDFHTPVNLGRYRLLSRLAVGGMAEIFLARVEGIGGFEKALVVKRLIPQFAQDPMLVRMFMDEARLLAKLDHPNITQVHDIGAESGQYFFAMEYVHGEDLRTLTRAAATTGRGAGDAVIAGIGAAAARALHYVHEKRADNGRPLNIVHRDVSPSNILVSYEGAVKLADFGVAKWDEQQTRTTAGTLKGKLAYMSPEQAGGHAIDRRSDIFSLGIVLFELATGTRLFQGATDMAVLRQLSSGVIPLPSRRRPNFPARLQDIVLRALAPAPAQRYATAQALAEDLEAYAASVGEAWDSSARAALMHSLFPRKLANWQGAQQEGLTLPEHLARLPAAEVTPLAQMDDLGLEDEVTQPEAPPPESAEPAASKAWFAPARLWWVVSLGVVVAVGAYSLRGPTMTPAPTAGGTAALPVRAPAETISPSLEPPTTEVAEAPTHAKARALPTIKSTPVRAKRRLRKRPMENQTAKASPKPEFKSAADAPTSPTQRVPLWDPDSVLLPQ